MMISTSSNAASSSTTESIRVHHLNQSTQHYSDNQSDGNASDEDILHVVTNVYTIPIIKSTSAGNGPFIQSSQQHINTTTSFDDDILSRHHLMTQSTSVPIAVGEPRLELQSKSGQYERMKRIIDHTSSHQTSMVEHQHMTQSMTQSGQDLSKSKFQIRSIVEIYESDQPSSNNTKEIDLSFKTATHVAETIRQEIINEPVVLKGKLCHLEHKIQITQ